MKITDIVLFRVSGVWTGPTFPAGNRQARPIDLYPEFNQQSGGTGHQPGDLVHALYLEIQTDAGVSGLFGPIEEWQAFHIHKTLRPFLLSQDPLAIEMLHDQMVRLDRHGRSGLFMTAISAIDIALWDLKGKAWQQPIYRLLGGPTRSAVPAYASMLGFSTAPANAAATAQAYKAQGFTAQKWFFRYGPADGAEGMEQNLAMAQAVREAVGPLYTLMFDAFMGWDVTYASAMVRALEPLHPAWMEEPIPPERVAELRKLREASRVPIATGEHVYTRWQTKELLVGQAVDILQNDPDWTGGITEQVKICALASAFETPVVAHGHSLLPALHVAAAQSPAVVPRVEYLLRYQPGKQFFQTTIYQPENGLVTLPTLPGLGMVLDEGKIEKRVAVSY
ncbi:MAG: mandelate racemase/muconate lactonizing protein [Chloroflexi bacterium]|nr:mandelate racemase/muconate lactonizing protein [Chloroflexota bacterium]